MSNIVIYSNLICLHYGCNIIFIENGHVDNANVKIFIIRGLENLHICIAKYSGVKRDDKFIVNK